MTLIAEFSLNHPTLPNVRVRVIQNQNHFVVEEYRDGVHTNDHYFPQIQTVRDIRREARAILAERRRESY